MWRSHFNSECQTTCSGMLKYFGHNSVFFHVGDDGISSEVYKSPPLSIMMHWGSNGTLWDKDFHLQVVSNLLPHHAIISPKFWLIKTAYCICVWNVRGGIDFYIYFSFESARFNNFLSLLLWHFVSIVSKVPKICEPYFLYVFLIDCTSYLFGNFINTCLWITEMIYNYCYRNTILN